RDAAQRQKHDCRQVKKGRDRGIAWVLNAELESDPCRGKRGNVKLSFSADVEQSAAKRNGDRQAGEDQRRRIEQCVANPVRPRERAADQQFVSLNRTVTNNPNYYAADNERRDDGD